MTDSAVASRDPSSRGDDPADVPTTVRLVGLGDNVVDRYVDHGVVYPGGNAVNVAVHARRSGAETGYIGIVGTDDGGDLIESSLRSEGVDVARLRRLDGETAFATVFTDETGNRSFGLCLKGVSLFQPGIDDLAYIAGFDVVHLCETIRMEESLPALAGVAAVSYDFSDRDDDYAGPLLPHISVATFSRPDSSDDEVEAQIAWAHAKGARVVIVTRGARGAVVSDGSTIHHQPAAPAHVVDTLGAGDSFIARLVVGLWGGIPVTEAARAAASYSADVCGIAGGFGHGRPLVAAEQPTTITEG